MTAKELRAKAQGLYNGGYDFELGDREQNIRILEADDLMHDEAEALYEYICDLKEHEYEGKTFSVKPYWLHESFSNAFYGGTDDDRYTFEDAKATALMNCMHTVEYIELYLDEVEE